MQDEQNDTSSRSNVTHDITARIQSLRNILTDPTRNTTYEQRVALRALDSEEQDRVNDSHNTFPADVNEQSRVSEAETSTRLRTGRTANNRNRPRSPRLDNVFDLSSSASVVRTRRSTWRTRETLERDQRNDRIERQRSRLARIGTRDDQVETEPESLSTLSPSQLNRARQMSENQEDLAKSRDGRPAKRRKLDDGSYEEPMSLVEYGLEGTLHPGNLRMKVLESSQVDGVLQANEGVKSRIWDATNEEPFRCRRSRLTLLMKHEGGWPFSLSHLDIKVPQHEFEIQGLQGMVFVSMEDHLCEKTLYYDTVLPKKWAVGPKHIPRSTQSFRSSQEYFQPRFQRYAQILNRRMAPLDLARPDWYDPKKGLGHGHEEDDERLETSGQITTEIECIKPEEETDPTSPRSPRTWDDLDPTSRRYHQFNLHENARARGVPARDYQEAPTYLEVDDEIDTSTESEPDEDDLDGPPYPNISASTAELEHAERAQRTRVERMRARQERGESLVTSWSSVHDIAEPRMGDRSEPANYSRQAISRKRLPSCRDAVGSPSPEAYKDRIVPVATFQVGGQAQGIKIKFDPEV